MSRERRIGHNDNVLRVRGCQRREETPRLHRERLQRRGTQMVRIRWKVFARPATPRPWQRNGPQRMLLQDANDGLAPSSSTKKENVQNHSMTIKKHTCYYHEYQGYKDRNARLPRLKRPCLSRLPRPPRKKKDYHDTNDYTIYKTYSKMCEK